MGRSAHSLYFSKKIVMRQLAGILLLILMSCSSGSKLKKYYSESDKSVVALVEQLKKDPDNREAARLLPEAYQQAVSKKQNLRAVDFDYLSPGDRYMHLVKEWGVMQELADQIRSVPAAAKLIPELWNPNPLINDAREKAANEYYLEGVEYLNQGNRLAASKALDFFNKANKAVPGFRNTGTLIREATEMARLKVVVRAPDYYRQSWQYWGFQNDWLQQRIIADLNAQSYRNVAFYSEADANRLRIRPDKLVELQVRDLYIGTVSNEKREYLRMKKIETGQTRSIPPQPVFTDVQATVYVTRKVMRSNASLECRIYDNVTGANLLFDRFPGNDEWQSETAYYRGDKRALLPEDWQIINKQQLQIPIREEVARKLIEQCYQTLLNRIQRGVQFGS